MENPNPFFKVKYINLGDKLDNIKKLKMENKLKQNDKHSTFHKKFKSFTHGEEKQEGGNMFLKTMSNFHNSQEGIMLTTHSNFTSSPNKHANTKSNFFKTHHSNFPQITNYSQINSNRNNFTEEDTNNLIQMYHITTTEENKYNNNIKNLLNKDEKTILMERFKMNKKLEESEQHDIDHTLDKNFEGKNEFSKTMNHFNRTNYKVKDYYFYDPYKSLKKLKVNSQVFNNVMSIRTEEQINKYMTQYEDTYDKFMKVMQMPKIRETKSNKNKILFEQMHNEAINELSEIKQAGMNNKQVSRDQLLRDIEFQVTFENFKQKPNARAQFTINLDGPFLILFGGINSDRLCDIWICDINSSKL
jgi:hypothetical protein